MNKSMIKNGFLLALFALICTALVAIVHESTKEQIKQQQELQLIRTLNQLIPAASYDNEMFRHCIRFSSEAELATDSQLSAYVATAEDQPVAIAMESIAPDGYNGKIKLIIGMDIEGQILGVRTLSHQETPGLGDKIDLRKSDWVTLFNGKSLTNTERKQWQVKKDGGDFDQFTGATITPRAYVGAVHKTLTYFNKHKTQLLMQSPNCEVDHE